ncbi:MAG: carboxymuconolactone decarboxylase family protein [Phycisphaerales bacterium]
MSGRGEEMLRAFREGRAEAQARLESCEHLGIKRFLRLDAATYEGRDGALDARTQELLGLVASAVLRCDDCITYHVERCVSLGWSKAEIEDAFNVAMIVGGSIVIPHARRALLVLDALLDERDG